MQENRWLEVASGVVLPPQTPPHSPRLWLARAFDSNPLNIETATPNFRSISVAAIFPRGQSIPELDTHCIYYLTQIGGKPVTGISAVATKDQMFEYLQQFRRAGATHIWYHWPEAPRKYKPEKVARVEPLHQEPKSYTALNHNELYLLFDQGQKPAQIAKARGGSATAIT